MLSGNVHIAYPYLVTDYYLTPQDAGTSPIHALFRELSRSFIHSVKPFHGGQRYPCQRGLQCTDNSVLVHSFLSNGVTERVRNISPGHPLSCNGLDWGSGLSTGGLEQASVDH